MAFLNLTMPEEISQGLQFVPDFPGNTMLQSKGGYRVVNIGSDSPIRQYTIDHILQDDEKRRTLLDFLIEVRGNGYSWKFRDWSDYMAGLSWVGDIIGPLGDPSSDLVPATAGQHDFQMYKVYGTGVNNQLRKITKPIADTCSVYNKPAGVWVLLDPSAYIISETTGIIHITAGQAAGTLVGWRGEFYTHARFANTSVQMQLDAPHVGEWMGVAVLEEPDA
jgi:uncharacterized protein (TIGR02217 family)